MYMHRAVVPRRTEARWIIDTRGKPLSPWRDEPRQDPLTRDAQKRKSFTFACRRRRLRRWIVRLHRRAVHRQFPFPSPPRSRVLFTRDRRPIADRPSDLVRRRARNWFPNEFALVARLSTGNEFLSAPHNLIDRVHESKIQDSLSQKRTR